ncbi:MAG: manganese efflux pump MntP family protein [Spirochaetaceae bacterium]|jgi:putative Mn2+ efflux pump MntP|nr:manganese efflux pump MntP family protein [Spirochaetaceae bacterium]
MGIIELILIAVGLSMDAFAVSVCTGLSLRKTTLVSMLIVGLYFGVFQAVMPLIGYFLGARFADKITSFDHWIVFVLLCVIGGKMIVESFSREKCEFSAEGNSLGPAKMLPLAFATSIDALAVGISFAFLNVAIVPAVISIGVITFLLSATGIKIGGIFGLKFKAKAEIAGGVILILIGVKILLEHLGILNL